MSMAMISRYELTSCTNQLGSFSMNAVIFFFFISLYESVFRIMAIRQTNKLTNKQKNLVSILIEMFFVCSTNLLKNSFK